ncbi:MAG: hypothetical protein QXG98_03450 [Candidatus Micrarchaeia archaeon]
MALLLLHLAAAGEVIFDYTEEMPGFALFASCSPRSMGPYTCSYPDNVVRVFTSGNVCSKDVYKNIFLVTKPTFTFTIPHPADGTITLSILECYWGIPKLSVSINGRCSADIHNTCYHKCSGGQHERTVSFPANCFNAGTNTLSITDGIGALLAQGSGSCPALSCKSVPLYARMAFSPSTIVREANASFELLEDSVRYTLSLLGSSNMSVLRFTLPPRVSNFSCDNCSLENDTLSATGALNASYTVPRIVVLPALLDGHPRDGYFPGERVRIAVTARVAGSPAGDVLVSTSNVSCLTADDGSCVLELLIADSEPLGPKPLTIGALESPLGSRGEASTSILVEANTTDIVSSEELAEAMLAVSFTAINNKHTPFNDTISYPLPADFVGSLEAEADGSPLPVSLDGSLASFNASCPEYANCSFSLRFRVAGIEKMLVGELLPAEARVGQPLHATLKFIFNNTNPLRKIRQTFADASEGVWTLDAPFGPIELEPNASLLLFANASMPGPSECAPPTFLAPSQTRREVRACIRIPEDSRIPTLPIRYAFAKEIMADWASAVAGSAGVTVDGSEQDVMWAENSSAIEIVVGTNHTNSSLHEGDHQVVFYYDVPAPPPSRRGGGRSSYSGSYYPSQPPSPSPSVPPAESPSTIFNAPNTAAGASAETTPATEPESAPASEPSNQSQTTEPIGPAIELFLPSTALINEPVSIAVLRQGVPASGWLSITSPSGMVSVGQLSGGRLLFVFDEAGNWSISFGNLTAFIEVVGPSLPPKTKPLSNTLSGPQVPDYAWMMVLALLLPLPVLALLIYAVAFRPRLELIKSVEGDRVKLRLENVGVELWNARLLDIIQDGELVDAGDAKISDTIFGRVLCWERGIVRANEGWEVSYRVSGVANHAAAELIARTKNGEIKLKSRPVRAS